MTARERFDELVSNYLDDALDAEGTTELSSLLATRPEYAARFVTFSRLHAGLRDVASPAPPVGGPRRWVLFVALAAGAILLAVLLLLRR